jgi:short subunit dehydrogenase-like uncharacterized protein
MNNKVEIDLKTYNKLYDDSKEYEELLKQYNALKETTKKEVLDTSITKNNIITDDKTKSKYKNGLNLNDNYTITFKIDADIEDYLKNIEKIAFIESVKSGKINSTTRTEFVNNQIREQYYKLIGASDKDSIETINKKWLKYKSDNNL